MKKILKQNSITKKPTLNRASSDSKTKGFGLYADANTYNKYRFYYMQRFLSDGGGAAVLHK